MKSSGKGSGMSMQAKTAKCPKCGKKVKLILNNTKYDLRGHKDFCSKAGAFVSLLQPVESEKINIIPESIAELVKPEPDEDEIGLRVLYPYQEQMLDWAVEYDKIPLFVEMRLGKTIVTIRWAKKKLKKKYGKDWRNKGRVLILAPKSVVPVWEKELKQENLFAAPLNTKIDRGLRSIIEKMPGWFVSNYETVTFTAKNNSRILKEAEHYIDKRTRQLRKRTETGEIILEDSEHEREINTPEEREDYGISKLHWDIVILDESTKLKDPRTKISKHCTNDFKNVECKAILTGTPAPENILDYFQQLKFLYGKGICGCDSYYQFKDKFFYSPPGEPNKNILRPGVKEYVTMELANIAYILKRSQVGRGSEKVYEPRYVRMEGEYLERYKEFEKTWIDQDYQTEWAVAAWTHMLQLSGGYPKRFEVFSEHKLKELENLVEENFKNDQYIVWCNFNREIRAISERFKELGIKHGVLAGNQEGVVQEKFKNYFNSGDIQCLICNQRKISMGQDFSKADQAVYFSRWLGALIRMQSEDRIIHPEKKTPCLILDIICEGSIDIDCYQALQAKVSGQEEFLKLVQQNFTARTGIDVRGGKYQRA